MAKVSRPRVKLEREFFEAAREALKDDLRSVGDAVAESAQASAGVPVDNYFERDQNGDWRALVTIAHPSGIMKQIKHGTLTRAAAEQGLEVHRYDGEWWQR